MLSSTSKARTLGRSPKFGSLNPEGCLFKQQAVLNHLLICMRIASEVLEMLKEQQLFNVYEILFVIKK